MLNKWLQVQISIYRINSVVIYLWWNERQILKWTLPITTLLFPAVFVQRLVTSFLPKKCTQSNLWANNIKTVHTENTESQTAESHNEFTDRAVIKKKKKHNKMCVCCTCWLWWKSQTLPSESTEMVNLQNPLSSVDSMHSDIIRLEWQRWDCQLPTANSLA